MKSFFIYNNSNIGKTISSYYLAHYFFSNNKKVLIINFDKNSIYKKIVVKWKNFFFDETISEKTFNTYLMKFDFFDCINFFKRENTKIDNLNLFFDKFKSFSEKNYDVIIYDNCLDYLNLFNIVFISSDIILFPIDVNIFNYEDIWKKIKSFDISNKRINFFIANFDYQKKNNFDNYLRFKKTIGFLLLINNIKFYNFSDSTLYFNKKEIEKDYYNLFDELKII